jgi:DNA-binding MarR family transcriptional regulator/N-acetylglutamate synthase-like GNAT family acetyltransferase
MPVSADDIALVRAFNRDYTRRIGLLADGVLDRPYSLTEVRVMYELQRREGITAAELADELSLDRGYLSRILKQFEANKLLVRETSAEDGRRQHLRLSAAGKRVFAPLNRRQQERVEEMLATLGDQSRRAVVEAMQAIHREFADSRQLSVGEGCGPFAGSARSTEQPANLTLRAHRAGDMGWVIERHGELYTQEQGWNAQFEALVAEIAAEFIRKFDPSRERCWIAERAGRRLGCIFLVAGETPAMAKLRLLLVEPQARGSGLGGRLIAECVGFARAAGYQKITLWTQDTLTAARHLYASAGFKLTSREAHHSFGHDLVGETWEVSL